LAQVIDPCEWFTAGALNEGSQAVVNERVSTCSSIGHGQCLHHSSLIESERRFHFCFS
jgi:hypothetical protein